MMNKLWYKEQNKTNTVDKKLWYKEQNKTNTVDEQIVV
jgi:hypothetical protein